MPEMRVPPINKVIIAGRLCADPETFQTPGGITITNIRLASDRHFRTKDGEKSKETCFVDGVLFGDKAERVAKNFRKGDGAIIDGTLKLDQWEDDAGNKRSKLKINVWSVEALSWPEKDGDKEPTRAAPHAEAPPRPRLIEEPIPEDDIPF